MQPLYNRHILLGISGGIAAYKSAELVRLLKKAGAQVHVVMTDAATDFITPLTLQALSGNPVHTTLLDPEAEAGMGHIELARWADAILIAPTTANTLAKLNSGLANDLLSTIVLASQCPLYLAPAMNHVMWCNDNTQQHVTQLENTQSRRIQFFGPASGEQACGDVGPGRMLEPEALLENLVESFQSRELEGLNVVITAGPTKEALDPVRYISNHSSGKMGYSLAQAACDAGAQVTLISGPVALEPPQDIHLIPVITAQDMHQQALACLPCDIFIATAAVSDYRPVEVQPEKIKKSTDELTITLTKNPDIVHDVAHSNQRPFTIGFAAETQNVEGYAIEKCARKNLDLIIANDVSQKDIGFGSDDNAVCVYSKVGLRTQFEKMKKTQLATQLIQFIANEHKTTHSQ